MTAKKQHAFRSTKQDWLEDLINEVPPDTADYDYLVKTALPRLSVRELTALVDAFALARRDGQKKLNV